MEGYQWWVAGRIGEKGIGNKKHNRQTQNRQREIKNSEGNEEAKELICTTNGHELSGGNVGEGRYRTEGSKGEKKWGNCNSIINKVY